MPDVTLAHLKDLLVEAVCLVALVLQIDSSVCCTPLSTAAYTHRSCELSVLLKQFELVSAQVCRLLTRFSAHATDVVTSRLLLRSSDFLPHVCQSLMCFHLFCCIVYAMDFYTKLIKSFFCILDVTTVQSTLACLLYL